MSIENDISVLETILDDLENPKLDLNTAVDKYAQGIKIAEVTFKSLNEVSQKLNIINDKKEQLLQQESFLDDH
jgi:exodeoxyribonuclease VII small subunit